MTPSCTPVIVDRSEVEVEEQVAPGVAYLDAATTLADVAQALSTLGVTPLELASIIQAVRAAGALQAEVSIQ
jgi:flagellar P-ring protein precursor FlgI